MKYVTVVLMADEVRALRRAANEVLRAGTLEFAIGPELRTAKMNLKAALELAAKEAPAPVVYAKLLNDEGG